MGRAKVAGAVMAAFAGGVLLASTLEWPREGFAQAGRPAGGGPSGPRDDGGAPGFAEVAEKVVPAVVSIEVAQDARRPDPRQRRPQVPPGMEEFFRQFEGPQQRPREGSGTGFLISADGYILTNNHVVADADRMTVTLSDHRQLKATLVGRDPTTDVAVIKVDAKGLPVLPLGNDETARIGNWVIAVGNPLGLDFTVTAGIISAKGRGGNSALGRLLESRYAITDFIQTDAAINPGNSGGPLLNARGEVIGINSAIASQTGFYSGYGFAIPITLAKQVADDLIKYGRVRRAVLGIQIAEVTPEDAKAAGLDRIMGVKVGALAADGVAGSPARDAGLEVGDIIVKVDGREADRVSTLQRIVRGKKPGDVVAVEVARFGDRKSFRVKLAEAPPETTAPVAAREDDAPSNTGKIDFQSFDNIGISVAPLSAAQAEQARIPAAQRGLRVTDVDVAGSARGKLFPGFDVITEIVFPRPRRAVRTVGDLEAAVKPLRAGDVITVTVYDTRTRESRVETLRVGE